ncbi:ERF family protein [Paracoccus onubensis]|nr:ERF family protein [Paracoccus onubensis]MDP0925690.1 ERF family protein [Paracoccus onubensis]
MKERVDAQSARIAFSHALASARKDMPTIVKDAVVDFTSSKGRTHYKHETLAGIAKQIDPILAANGLSYRFRTGQQNGVSVTCIIEHVHGHLEETTLSASPDQSGNKNGFQAIGSAVTYLQRYTLKAALGLSAEVDDDAQSAAPRDIGRQGSEVHERPQPVDMSRRADNMIAALKRNGVTEADSEKFKASFAEMRSSDSENAARVEAEIETLKAAANADLAGDGIPY